MAESPKTISEALGPLAGFLVIVFFIWLFAGQDSPESTPQPTPSPFSHYEEQLRKSKAQESGNKISALVGAQAIAKEEFKFPDTVDFESDYDQSGVTKISEGKYRVVGAGTSQNMFGVPVPFRYSCEVELPEKNDYMGVPTGTCSVTEK